MPPAETQRVAFNVGLDEIAGSYIRQVQTEFEELHGFYTKLPALFGYGEAKYLSEDYQHEWIKDELPENSVQLAASFTAASETDLTVDDGNLVMDHAVLAHGDQLFLVTSHASANVLNVTKSYAGTTAANLADNTVLRVLLPHSLDTATFPEGIKTHGEFAFNNPMLYLEKISATDVRETVRSYLTRNQNELDFAATRKKIETDRRLDANIIYGKPLEPTDTVRGMFGGVRHYVTSNVTAVDGEFVPRQLFDMLDQMRLIDENTMGKMIITTMNGARIWDSFWRREFNINASIGDSSYSPNLKVDAIDTRWGHFEITVCDQMPAGEMWIVNPGDIKLVPINTPSGSGWMEHSWGADVLQKRAREKGWSNVLTLEVKNEKRHARFTGIDETLNLYADVL
jgi:hypothetical protein